MKKDCIICQKEFEARWKNRSKCCADKKCQDTLRRIRLEKYRQNPEFIKKRQVACKRYNQSEKRKNWVKKNWNIYIKKQTQKQVARRKIDPEFRLLGTLRRVMGRIFEGRYKNKSWKDVVSYNTKELRAHLEKQFHNGMSWKNYGVTGWHIDHKKAMSEFKFFDKQGNINVDAVRECMSLDNLQPLWFDENIRKGGINRKIRLIKKEN